MTKKDYFQISTAIDYPSGKPHVGHLYEKIIADVLARWNRLNGKKVHFSTGLDCHGSKIERYAKEAGETPLQFIKDMEPFFLKLCKEYNISYNDFIKTTEERHKKVVTKFIENLNKKGYIYKGTYSGYYCSDCETYFSKEELIGGFNCPTHNKPTELLEENSYFFKMSKFQKKLINHIKKNPNFIQPKERKNEILSRLKEPLRDLSLTRERVKWGIPFPLDKNLIVAIWSEALLNYLTTVDYPNQKYKDFWPALHIIGLDISWHHTVIWGSLLMASNVELPRIFVHGFIRAESGEKMSKSLGNVIDPLKLVETYPSDAIRYYLIREIPTGNDGSFSEKALIKRLNNELANDLGNLVSRVLTLIEKNFPNGLKKSDIDKRLSSKLNLEKVGSLIDNFELHNALNEIWRFINECNKHINQEKPWEMEEKEKAKHLYSLAESIRVISILISPFLPETSEKINKQLGVKSGNLKDATFGVINSYKVKKEGVLFKKRDQEINEQAQNKNPQFTDLDLRIARIKEVKDHPNADKLYILTLDVGKEEKQIVSGLKLAYKKEELLNKNIIVIHNLESSNIRGVESKGMLLAVEDDKGTLSLLTINKSKPGDKVYTDQPKSKPLKEIKFNDFKRIKIVTKNNKVYYQGKSLKTDKEDIFLDKEMPNNLIVE